jgi:hypothetical protein
LTPRSLEAFDPVEQTLVTGRRDTTTVPSQALYLLNSSFVRRQSLELAELLLKPKDAATNERIQAAYRLMLGRAATQKEYRRARAFLAEYESAYPELPHLPTKPKLADTVKPKKPAQAPANPDEIDQTGEPITEEVVEPNDARTAAWLAFVQSLFGCAEFRYLR